MGRYFVDTLTGAVTAVSEDDDVTAATLIATRQGAHPGRPQYEEVGSDDHRVTRAYPHAGGGASRLLVAFIELGSLSLSSSPTTYVPIAPGVGPVFGSLPGLYAAGLIAAGDFKVPDDGGAAVTLNYVELTVTNQAATEVLIVSTAVDLVIAAGVQHLVSAAELSTQVSKIGTDLSLDVSGYIASAAGGVFTAGLAFDIT